MAIDFNPEPQRNAIDALSGGLQRGLGLGAQVQQLQANRQAMEFQRQQAERAKQNQGMSALKNLTALDSRLIEALPGDQLNLLGQKTSTAIKDAFGIDAEISGEMLKKPEVRDVFKRANIIINDKTLSDKEKRVAINSLILESRDRVSSDDVDLLQSVTPKESRSGKLRAGERILSEAEYIAVLKRMEITDEEIKNGVTEEGIPIPREMTAEQARVMFPVQTGMNINIQGDPFGDKQ